MSSRISNATSPMPISSCSTGRRRRGPSQEEWHGPGETPGRMRLAALEAANREAPQRPANPRRTAAVNGADSAPQSNRASYVRMVGARLPQPVKTALKRAWAPFGADPTHRPSGRCRWHRAARIRTMSGPSVQSAELPPLKSAHATPPLREYLSDLWARREYVWFESVSEIRSRQVTNVLGNLWNVLTPALNIAIYFLIFGLLLGVDRGVDNFISLPHRGPVHPPTHPALGDQRRPGHRRQSWPSPGLQVPEGAAADHQRRDGVSGCQCIVPSSFSPWHS